MLYSPLNTKLIFELKTFLSANTENLMDRILNYAIELGYSKYTSTLKEAWRASIVGLNTSISDYLDNYSVTPELACGEDGGEDPVSAFGVLEAKRHRQRGISIDMFLGLYKYYLWAYLDTLDDFDGEEADRAVLREFIIKVFGKIEHAFVVEWVSQSTESKINELSVENRLLTNEKNKYLTIFESAFIPLIYLDKEGGVENINHSALSLFESGDRSGAFYYGDAKMSLPAELADYIGGFIESKVLSQNQISELNLNGTQYVFEVRLKRMLDISGKFSGIMMSLHDVTEVGNLLSESDSLKKLNEVLGEQLDRQQEIRRKHEAELFNMKKLTDMGLMINAIAHQWRQPINALGLYIQDIVMEAELGGLQSEYLEDFRQNTMKLITNLSDTIDDFRTFYKPDKEKANFEIIHAVTELLRLINVQITSKQIDISVKCSCRHKSYECVNSFLNAPCEYRETRVYGFPGEFKQVFMNVLYNAIYSIKENIAKGKVHRGRLDIVIEAKDEFVGLSITDNGTGIPEDVLAKVFDPYFTTKDEGMGTGLGLYMSKLIIEEHMKGSITAQNNDVGAMFTIRIPVDVSQAQSAAKSI